MLLLSVLRACVLFALPFPFLLLSFRRFEITSLVFRWKKGDTTLVLTFCRIDCRWTVKCKKYRNGTAHANALHEIVMGPNFPSHTVEYVTLKAKTIRTRYAAEPAKVIRSEKSGSSLDDVHGRERDSCLRCVCAVKCYNTSRQPLTVALKGGSAVEV